MMQSQQNNILALDVGERRIGVAIANYVARIPSPLTTITGASPVQTVADLVTQHNVSALVVGLPRSMDGSESTQTKEARQFADLLKNKIKVPMYFQDEAVTSIQAEKELKSRGKPYSKEDIDALAATYILEDFLNQQDLHDKLERHT